MRWLLSIIVAGAALALLAQQPPQEPSAPTPTAKTSSPPRCRDDRSVDEYVVELKKAKKQRNKNPFPTGACIGGLCVGKVEKPQPEASPAPPPPQPKSDRGGSESSSRENAGEAAQEEAPKHDPMAAAQNVDVGDYYFSEKNYRAALSRYQEALEAKPNDEAIYIRLGRVFERLDEPAHAFENYDASVKADPGGPASEEARKGVQRLRPEVEKRGDDPAAISERNRARVVPLCPKPGAASSSPPR